MPNNVQSEPYAPMAMMGPSSPSEGEGRLFESEGLPQESELSGEELVVPNRTALSRAESQRLILLENKIRQGLHTFYEVGNALVEIRESRLYRRSYDTFEFYCREQWGMTRQHANRMISAAKVIEDLEPTGSTPSSEAVARPLARLSPDDRQKAWTLAQKWAGVGPVTADIVEQAAKEVAPHAFVSKQRSETSESQPTSTDAPQSPTLFGEDTLLPASTPSDSTPSEAPVGDQNAGEDSADEQADARQDLVDTLAMKAEGSQSAQVPGKPGPKPNPDVAATPAPSKTPSQSTAKSVQATPTTPTPTAPSPIAPPLAVLGPKAPDGFMSTFVPKDNCFWLQDEGYSMQEIFSTMRALVEMGQPFGLSPDDLLTTLRTALGLDSAELEGEGDEGGSE